MKRKVSFSVDDKQKLLDEAEENPEKIRELFMDDFKVSIKTLKQQGHPTKKFQKIYLEFKNAETSEIPELVEKYAEMIL